MSDPKLKPGYMYELDDESGWKWTVARNDAWDTVMRSSVSGARWVGERNIDGVRHNVFQIGGKFLAQTKSHGGKRRSTPFAKLTRKLADRGARDPKALAAWIGRRDIGQAEMTRRSVKGRRGGKKRHGAGLIAAAEALRDAWK